MVNDALRDALENFYWLSDSLFADLTFAMQSRGPCDDRPEPRRTYVRAAFTYVEGCSNAFNRIALAAHDARGDVLLESDVEAVRQELDVDARPHFPRFLDNVKLAVRRFGKAIEAEVSPDFSGRGWAALRDGVDIRNRLVHPRTPSDLAISDADLLVVEAGVGWFRDETGRLMASGGPRRQNG